jgi:hypothetical protein
LLSCRAAQTSCTSRLSKQDAASHMVISTIGVLAVGFLELLPAACCQTAWLVPAAQMRQLMRRCLADAGWAVSPAPFDAGSSILWAWWCAAMCYGSDAHHSSTPSQASVSWQIRLGPWHLHASEELKSCCAV